MSDTNNSNHYVTREEFRREYAKCLKMRKCSENLVRIFNRIAKRYSVYYIVNTCEKDRTAMINFAVSHAWRKWDRYNESEGELFSYFTQIIRNALNAQRNELYKNSDRHISIQQIYDASRNVR